MRESYFLEINFSEILLVPMPGRQVTLLVRNTSYFTSQYLNFNIIASDSDLVLNFSFLGFRAITINLIILGDEIFFGNMKWLTFFLSAVCHYILTLLEDNGCAAGSGEATSSVLS